MYHANPKQLCSGRAISVIEDIELGVSRDRKWADKILRDTKTTIMTLNPFKYAKDNLETLGTVVVRGSQ